MMTQGSLRLATLAATALALRNCIPGPIYHRPLAGAIKALGGDWG
jgi:hypothetical protein